MSTENDFNEASSVWSGTSPPKVLSPHFPQSQAVVCSAWKLLSQLKSENEAFTIFRHLKNTYFESFQFQMLYHTCSSFTEKAQNFVFVHSFPHTLTITDCQKLRLIEIQWWFLSVIYSWGLLTALSTISAVSPPCMNKHMPQPTGNTLQFLLC